MLEVKKIQEEARLLGMKVLTQKEYDLLIFENAKLQHELSQLQRMIFGSKSERYVKPTDPHQLNLELDIEKQEVPEPKTETLTYTRNKTNRKEVLPHSRLPLPESLPRIEVVIEPEGLLAGSKKIGEAITEILDYEPGKLFVIKYVRPKYVLPEEGGIIIGELPSLPIPRGNAGAGLLSHLIVSKFVDHLPFYRQRQQFKRQGIEIAESTINDWFSSSCNLIERLYERYGEIIKQSDYLMVDETPIPVLTEDKPESTHKGYHWVYYDPVNKLVYFDYQKGRGREGPKAFLENFKGAIQADGYAGYNIFDNKNDIILLACMAHARRKFEQALDNDAERSGYAMNIFQKLYQIEREAREACLSFEQRKELRQEKSFPILQEFETWLKTELVKVLPKSAIGKAIAYTMSLWHRLIRYVDDGKYEIDNNLVENSIRPVALGRKNYMFAGSHEGAKRAAMIYSLLSSCKKNEVDPYQWLKDVITRMPDCKLNQLDELLPANWKNNTSKK
jgi:transposase